MKSVRFNYLYRDGGNFKSWGYVIFAASKEIDLKDTENRLVQAFLSDGQFNAKQIGIPELFLFCSDKMTMYDHCFHEFFSLESCHDMPTDIFNRSIEKFLRDVEVVASSRGWVAFDITEYL
jgi:hypothetical protein